MAPDSSIAKKLLLALEIKKLECEMYFEVYWLKKCSKNFDIQQKFSIFVMSL